MVQVPAARMPTDVPLTEHTEFVNELYVTASPDDAVAGGLIAKLPPAAYGREPTACTGKVMVWPAELIMKVRETGAAALKSPLPVCVASTVQLPVATIVRLAPLTLQVDGVLEANVTPSVDVAVAVNAIGTALKFCAPGLLNVMVWLAFCTVSVKLCVGAPLALVAVKVSG